MKLEYRRIKDNHKMRSWKFYDVMDRVLANRPAITYSSLGGAVIAQQVFQSPGGPDTYLQGAPASSFGPVSSGGFLFGHPPRSGDLLDIKCEDVEDGMLNSGDAPPEMYYGSGDDQETDVQSILETEDALGRGEGSTNTRISPSDFSDLNMPGSTATAKNGGDIVQPDQPSKDGGRPLTSVRQRKRRWAGRGSRPCDGARCGGQRGLDKALASFLSWQQSAEERLLSLEETRLEREAQAEERREQQEERRAEQERQHELRLLSVFAGALAAVRQGAPTSATTPYDPPISPLAYLSTSLMTTNAPSASSSLSQHPPEAPTTQATSTAGTPKSPTPTSPPPSKACQTVQKALATLRGADTPGHSVYLSNRGNGIRRHQGILQEGYAQYHADKHHDVDNPNGILNMGTSENKLCYDLLHKRLTQPDMLHIDPSLLQYPDWKGHSFLRKEVARFLSHYCGCLRPLNADNVVVMNGCGSLFSSIAAVICDPEDAILIPTPFYGVITEDLHLYSGVKLFHVPLDCEASGKDSRPFHLTVAKLEEALRRAEREGVIIRAVILVNPHNPLAEVYTPQEMTGFLEFAKRHELHAIVDEVYMLTVFDESVVFHSVLSIDRLPDPQRTHVMWGISKDFAMAGIRVGTLYTENRDLVEALDKLGAFHGVPGPTQHQVAQLLRDRDWISEEFLPENRRRVQAAHSYLTAQLRSMGIPYLHRPACFYVWADLRKYLRESSFAGELSLWRCFIRHKVVLSCGQAFSCSTPGWFRLVFTDQLHRLELGVKRLREALKEVEDKAASPNSGHSKEASEESSQSLKKDSDDSDNTAIVNSTPSPSSDRLKEKDSPAPDAAPLASEEFVLLDCQTSKPTESLDSLIDTLKQEIRSSDWLEKNTPELSAGEDPEVLDVFRDLLQRARK
ncbi:1-aminocyclopropane-1-carboxylate synthase-like protein 1 isoform 2-T2 [Polymixia lowei]